MKIELYKIGASWNISLTGIAEDVAEAVNKLFNYGAISKIPDNFMEGIDTFVVVQSDKNRFVKAMRTVAYGIGKDEGLIKRDIMGRSNVDRVVKMIVKEMQKEFKWGKSYYENGNRNSENRVYAIGNSDYQNATDNVWQDYKPSLT